MPKVRKTSDRGHQPQARKHRSGHRDIEHRIDRLLNRGNIFANLPELRTLKGLPQDSETRNEAAHCCTPARGHEVRDDSASRVSDHAAMHGVHPAD